MVCKDVEELLQNINNGTLIEYLRNRSNKLCDNINKEIHFGEPPISFGGKASVYSIFTSSIPEGNYVVKKVNRHEVDIDTPLIYINETYKCSESFYIELMISTYISLLIDGYNGIMCKNFVRTYTFTVCKDAYYMFMKRENTTLTNLLHADVEIKDDELMCYIFQILFAILAYQRAFRIMHNDLHLGNIFLSNEKRKGMYRYILDGESYYIPTNRFLVKIGDWDLAEKFSTPMVIRGYNEKRKPKYTDLYDSAMFLDILFLDLNYESPFMHKIIRYALRLEDGEPIEFKETTHCRPPKKILKDMFGTYIALPPPGSNIIDMGIV